MKWNWGTKLVIWMAAFMTLIIVFAVLMINVEVNLVSADYYPKGQTHQELIDKRHNADKLSDQIQLIKDNGQLVLQFPMDMDYKTVHGEVQLYHVMDDKQDQFSVVKLDENRKMYIDANKLKGRYILKIDWKNLETSYYTEIRTQLP
jgi:hypothetical protein